MKRAFSKKNLWDQTQSLVKGTVGRGLGIFPPEWLLGAKFRANCKFVLDAQWWPIERSREYQLKKIQEILKLAYEKTEFYRREFDSIGFHPNDFESLDCISSLPMIDKQVIAKNISEMCTRPVTSRDVDFASTGGTSGMPLHFYADAGRSAVEYAYLTTSWERAGYKLGMPMAVLRSRIVHPKRNGLRHEYDPILRHNYYSVFHLSDGNMAAYLKHIATLAPCFLHVYPSVAATLARFVLRSSYKVPGNILGIIAESEIVYPEQRKIIEKVFGCRLFSCYGHSEKLVLGVGCEHSKNYHIWPTYGYFELLDKNNKPVTTKGQRGEIVGTGFINTVMPFIRYRTGDWATYLGDNCQVCGRKHTIICDIQGHRIQEVLIAADGTEISWTALNMHDDTFLHVRQFQFTQTTPGRAVLRIVPADGFSEKDSSMIEKNLGLKLDNRLKFTVKLVDSITLSTRGKAVYVDQRIPPDSLNCTGFPEI